MATSNVERADVFIYSKKVAALESSQLKLVTNGERQHGAEGVLAITRGNVEGDLTVNVIRETSPGAGTKAIEKAFRDQALATIAYKIGADLIYCAYKCTSAEYASESRSGSLKGVFLFQNAEPPQYA